MIKEQLKMLIQLAVSDSMIAEKEKRMIYMVGTANGVSREEVDERLKKIMSDIHESCVQYGKEGDNVNYVKGANIAEPTPSVKVQLNSPSQAGAETATLYAAASLLTASSTVSADIRRLDPNISRIVLLESGVYNGGSGSSLKSESPATQIRCRPSL